jgi:transposase
MGPVSLGSCAAMASRSSKSTDPTERCGAAGASSDPLDAIEAARAVLSGRVQGHAKTRDGAVEAIRVLLVAKRSARQARGKAIIQMRHLGFTAPEELRCQLRGLSVTALVTQGSELCSEHSNDPVTASTKASLRSLAKRVRTLESEIAALDDQIGPLVSARAPELLGLFGVGPDTAATLLVAAGDNPERLRSEAAWAHLCGVAPIQASSGKVTRHRLDRGGNRDANAALFRIVLVRIAHDPDTKAYLERRTKEGRSKLEVIRVLKRYVAREVYRHLPRR